VSRMAMPVPVPTGQVFSHMLGVFSDEGDAGLALLSSGIHFSWVLSQASTLETRIRYTPSDVYETFPQPSSSAKDNLTHLGSVLNETRSAIMLEHGLGLTKLYNRFHDPAVSDVDICELRGIHDRIDKATMDAYEWGDLDLEWEFQQGQQGLRYTLDREIQAEILDRLLELNHQRKRGQSLNSATS
ncbi:type IIL restriction-modification enzyme MmeI, partial [Streptomyces canus]|uniref:type IIL restriction-modification enzyme MmeI n=1 Tax=Streptomyces canus TaxID=58343 RepID=UPI00340AF549